MVPDKVRVEIAAHEGRVAQYVGSEAQCGFDASDAKLLDGAQHAGNGFGAVGPEGDQLGNHRVVINRDVHALFKAVVDAHAGALRPHVGGQRTDVGQEVVLRVFGVHAHFDGVAGDGELILGEGQRLALGHADLFLHQVKPRDLLRHGVFHLEAGIHFQEVEVVLVVEQEFHGAGAGVGAGAGHVHGALAHLGAQGGREHRRGRFLNHFLVAALDAALAFEQVHDVAVFVAQHLDFDVARAGYELLDEHRAVAKGRNGLVDGQLHLLLKFVDVVYDAHALAAAAGRSLDENGKADFLRNAFGGRHVGDGLVGAGHQRDVVGFYGLLGRELVAHHLHGLGAGAHENQPCLAHGAGKSGIFRKKAVAGVNGIDAQLLANRQNLIAAQVAVF